MYSLEHASPLTGGADGLPGDAQVRFRLEAKMGRPHRDEEGFHREHTADIPKLSFPSGQHGVQANHGAPRRAHPLGIFRTHPNAQQQRLVAQPFR
jgi:hypothetical protein